MSGINRVRIAKRILNSLIKKDLMKTIIIYRDGKNVFGEIQEKQYVCTIKGFYHRDKSKLSLSFSEGATVNNGYYEKLLVVYNEESKKIKQDDYFFYKEDINNEQNNGIKYQIIDKGNVQNIVYDMAIDRK
ncbi:hypothetical protein ACYIU4_002829 [Clostridium botulinum]